MASQLDALRQHSLVVADTGDIEAVARWKPQDATTNPSLLLASAADPRYRHLIDEAIAHSKKATALAMDWMFVLFGREILQHVAGRVSTEVDAQLSFDGEKSIEKARRLIALYEKHGYATQVMGASFRNTGQILALAGCDLLTIAPDLLEKLAKTEGAVPRKLSAASAARCDMPKVKLDETAFRWLFNEDAMATDKLAEGIRRFDADARKLEKLIVSLSAAVPAKV